MTVRTHRRPVIVDHGAQRPRLQRRPPIFIHHCSWKAALVDSHVRESPPDRLRPTRAQDPLGQPWQLEEENIPALPELRPRPQCTHETRRMRHVHDHEARKRAHLPDRAVPRDDRPPVMRDQQRLLRTRRIDQPGDIAHQLVDVIGAHGSRARCLAVAAQVRRPDPIAQPRQQRHLEAPRELRFRKPVQQQCELLARTALVHFEGDPVRSHEMCRYRRVAHLRLTRD